MPLSGRPTNAPLLKMTHGCSELFRNGCQNTRNADAAESDSEDSEACAISCPRTAINNAMARATTIAESVTAVIGQKREEGAATAGPAGSSFPFVPGFPFAGAR